MIKCAVHHTDIALCGCDPDEQYRKAQASKRTTCMNLTTAEMAALEGVAELSQPVWAMIQALRADEGDQINLLCDNPEGPPNNAVECCGSWTNWLDRRFEGETLHEAILVAYRARRAA